MEAVLSTFLTQTAQAVEPSEGTPEPTNTPGIILESSITPEGTQPAVNVTTTSGTPTATGPIEHVVAGGEWLLSIARLYDVDPEEIIALNGLTPPYALFPGQILKIPVEGSITPEPEGTPLPGGTTYIVQAGDWVYSIARKFGVEPDDIISANNLAYPYTLFVGQELIIP
jgi:LysM repeat protein